MVFTLLYFENGRSVRLNDCTAVTICEECMQSQADIQLFHGLVDSCLSRLYGISEKRKVLNIPRSIISHLLWPWRVKQQGPSNMRGSLQIAYVRIVVNRQS